jgi:DNA replication protein DnaC
LHELGFVERKENVVLLGPPGVGKTNLAVSLAIAAAQNGRRVYYSALADLVTSLEGHGETVSEKTQVKCGGDQVCILGSGTCRYVRCCRCHQRHAR